MNKFKYKSALGTTIVISDRLGELSRMPDKITVMDVEFGLESEELDNKEILDQLREALALNYPQATVDLDAQYDYRLLVTGVAPSGEHIEVTRSGARIFLEMFSNDNFGFGNNLYSGRAKLTGRTVDAYIEAIEQAAAHSIGIPLKQIEEHLGLGPLISSVSRIEDNDSDFPYLDNSDDALWLELEGIGAQGETIFIQHKGKDYQVFSNTKQMAVISTDLTVALDRHLLKLGGVINAAAYEKMREESKGDIY